MPKIPNLDPYKYKRYFITKGDYTAQFTLYLFEYEPPLIVDEWGKITTSLAYNSKVPYHEYTFTLGQEDWQHYRHYGLNYSMDLSYSTFAEKLLYHNFMIYLGEDIYNKNSLPNDQVIMPELDSSFPQIPDERGRYYNYYYITRDDRMEDKFYLTLYLGEPEKFVVDENGYFVASEGEGRWEEIIKCQQLFYWLQKCDL